MAKKLGVLGGLGPMASVYFYELLTRHTEASCDQDHLDLILSSSATTPDRTAFILGQSTEDPLPYMLADAERLVAAGADVIAIPCNTAHYFYDALAAALPVPIINIIYETVRSLAAIGVKKFGLLATAGTAAAGGYAQVGEQFGLECVLPSPTEQDVLSELIYSSIKQGKSPDLTAFSALSARLLDAGCDRLVLGCTELSLLRRDAGLTSPYFDSLDALAYRSILTCGKTPVGFDRDFAEAAQ